MSAHHGAGASDAMVAQALSEVGSVSPQDAAARMGRADVVVVDVRDAADWERERIPGAVHAARGMLEFHIDPASSFHLPVFGHAAAREFLFCCGSGARAALSARLAREMGLNATCIAGGLRAWRAAALPLAGSSSSTPSPESST